MKTDKVYLVGFMAAGKTTLARALAARLAWRAEDLDELIEAHEHLTVTEIFARYGEPRFRAAEREMLHLLLPMRKVVVATGGGTFADPENRTAINLDGLSIWLDVPLPEILLRLPSDSRRPLAADRARMEQLYTSRCDAYREAHLRLDAGGAHVPDLVERIADLLNE